MTDIIKEIKATKCLSKMIESDKKLYEKILDTKGFAFWFNELVKLASK